MGATSSSDESIIGEPNTGDAILNLYRRYCSKHVSGGHDSPLHDTLTMGGLADVEHYESTVMSAAKQQLIKDIASDLAEKIKVPQLSPKGKSLDEIIKQLKTHVPDPRQGKGNGKVWSDKEINQIKACEIMAKVINDRMGTQIINVKSKPGEVCEEVSEVMHSLLVGMHSEFSTVRGDVHRLLKNIEILMDMLRKQHSALDARMSRETDSTIGSETSVIRESHQDVMRELERQFKMLENMMGEVIKPADIELDKALKDVKEFRGLVRKIKQYPGHGKFGEKVSYALSGIRSVAQAAKVVDDALKKLGIKYAEYAKISSPKQLKEFLSEKTQKSLHDSEELLDTYEKAKRVLYTHEYMHDDVVKELEREHKGQEGRHEMSVHHGANESMDGDDIAMGTKKGGAKLDKRVQRRQDLKKALLRAFAERLNVIFDRILVAAESVGKSVGAGKILLSDTLEKFPKAIELLTGPDIDIQQKNVYFSLAGFYDDIRSREKKEKFVSTVRYVVTVLDDILKDGEYSKEGHFKDMKIGFEEMIKLIDEFSHKFTEGFNGPLPSSKKGADEDDESSTGGLDTNTLKSAIKSVGKTAKSTIEKAPEYLEKAGQLATQTLDAIGKVSDATVEVSKSFGSDDMDELDTEMTGAGEGDTSQTIEGGDTTIPEITKMAYQLNRLRDVILYYFRTARIRINLAKASTEMQAYGEDYVKILADAIAASVDNCIKTKNFYRSEEADENSDTYRDFVQAPKQNEKEHRSQKETLKNFIEMQCKICDTKVELYRIAEAVDLYMKAFADGIAAHPDDIRGILNILNGTEVISKWFTEKSGDLLCQVFDSFPASFSGDDARYNNLNENYNKGILTGEHYYVRVATICQLGDKLSLQRQIKTVVKPQPNGGPAFTWSAWKGIPGAPGVDVYALPGLKSDNPPIIQASPEYPSLPGNPFLGMPYWVSSSGDHTGEKAMKYAEKAMSVSMLKNIISVFVSVGSHFGGVDLFKKTHMSPIQIYKGLMNYIVQSSFTMGLKPNIAGIKVYRGPNEGDIGTNLGPILKGPSHGNVILNQRAVSMSMEEVADINAELGNPVNVSGPGKTIENGHIRIGITGQKHTAGTDKDIRKKAYVAMRSIDEIGPLILGQDLATSSPFANEYEETDLLFTLIIKSIVAKILTSIGVYNMFNRPINKDGLGYFSGLRMILGGAGEAPKVIPQALELYIRLPLLAEFYRKIFPFDETDPANSKDFRHISMIPEMDGVFSGLIGIIFDKAQYVVDGNYSDTDIRMIIEEINKIWLRFQDRKNLTSDVIHEFMAEINRRIGIYEREERMKYIEERKNRYSYPTVPTEEITDFELGTIDEYDTYPRPAPSMSYQTEGGISGKRDHKYKLDPREHMRYINQMRSSIDHLFMKAQDKIEPNLDNLGSTFTFDHMLRARREELKNAKTDKERFDIVHSAIVSLGQFSMSSLEKSFILFHESVVTPLSTLHSMYKMLKNFHSELDDLYLALKHFEGWSKTSGRNLLNPTDGLLFPNNASHAKVAPYLYGLGQAADVIVMAGQQGLLANVQAGLTYQSLENIIISNQSTANIDELLYRFTPNQTKILYKALELLYGHAATLDSLIGFRIEVAHDNDGETCAISVQIDHSKLRQYISEVFNSVKQSIDRFRGLISDSVIKKYEQMGNEGSLYWLEKYFIDELLDGKYGPDHRTGEQYILQNDNLDRANTKFKFIFDYLTREWEFNARGLNVALPDDWRKVRIVNPDGTQGPFINKKSKHEFSREIYELVFYDPFTLNSDYPTNNARTTLYKPLDAGPPAVAAEGYVPGQQKGLLKVLYNTSGKPKDGVSNNMPWDNTHTWRLNWIYDPQQGFPSIPDARRSVFIMFNRLIAAYLSQVYDDASGKVYMGAINEFANGAFSSAVLGKNYYDDTDVWATNDILGDPRADNDDTSHSRGVLVYTLSRILRQFLNEKNPVGDKQYLTSEISDVPLYMKEQMRASFPIFHKMFRYLAERCELLKVLVRALNINQPVDNANLAPAGSAGGLKSTRQRVSGVNMRGVSPDNYLRAVSNENNEKNMTKILDQIISGCNSVIQCIKNTLSDISDDPKYLETHQGFIQEYESTNGLLPFMPQSSMLYYLKNTKFSPPGPGDEINDIALPIYKLGDPKFKLQYGVRGVLCKSEISSEDMPGMVQIVKWHNQSTDQKHHFDEKLLNRMLDTHVALVRYLIDAKRYRGAFAQFVKYINRAGPAGVLQNLNAGGVLRATQPIYTHTTNDLINPEVENIVPYSLAKKTTLSDIIRMTESNFQKEQRRLIVSRVEGVNPCLIKGDREHMIVYNIIDLNVVPINMNALRREIPLVHLYNYSWTFDKLMCELFGLEDMSHIHDSGPIDYKMIQGNKSGRKLLGCLLLCPYKGVTNDVYEFNMSQISRGDLGIEGLGRPKYWADEIYGKALFGEIYPGKLYFEEGGPATGHGHLHGKQEVLFDSVFDGDRYKPVAKVLAKQALRLLCGYGGSYAVLSLFQNFEGGGLAAGAKWNAMIDNIASAALDFDLDDSGKLINHTKEEYTDLRERLRNRAMELGFVDPDFVRLGAHDVTQATGDEIVNADAFATMAIVIAHVIATQKYVRENMINNMRKVTSSKPGHKYSTNDLMNSMGAISVRDTPIGAVLTDIMTNFNTTRNAAGDNMMGIVGTRKEFDVLEFLNVGGKNVGKPPIYDSAASQGQAPIGAVLGANIKPPEGYGKNRMPILNGDLYTYITNRLGVQSLNEYVNLFKQDSAYSMHNIPQKTRRDIENNNERYFENALHYLQLNPDTKETEMKEVSVGSYKNLLQSIGKLRFDTTLVRNLFWLTNIQRALRLKLRRDLTWFDQRVVSDHAVTASGVTELFGNDVQSSSFPYNYNY
jgi:hypothetical protein